MRVFLILALLTIGCSVPADSKDVERQIDALFQNDVAKNGPGYAIGLVRKGQLEFGKGYGFSNLKAKTPITADTAFNIASLSKQFTAASIAIDLKSGKLGIDDRLADHWPGLPPFMSNITIAHLVYMTSGLKEYYTLPSPKGGWASEDRFTVDDAIDAVIASGKLEYEPGTKWSYSNTNYQFLAQLSGKLNERSFPDHMEKTIFRPLQMTNSWVDSPLAPNRANRATAYVKTQNGNGWEEAPRLSPHYGGSGIFSSLADLAKWDAALFTNQSFGAQFTEQMLTKRAFEHSKKNDAFGLVHGAYNGVKTLWYEGGDYGTSSYMVRIPARDETVVCLSNFGDSQCAQKAKAVLDILISE